MKPTADIATAKSFHVMVYGSSDTQATPRFNQEYPLNDRLESGEIDFFIDVTFPYFFHFRIFVEYTETETGCSVLTEFGHASCTCFDLLSTGKVYLSTGIIPPCATIESSVGMLDVRMPRPVEGSLHLPTRSTEGRDKLSSEYVSDPKMMRVWGDNTTKKVANDMIGEVVAFYRYKQKEEKYTLGINLPIDYFNSYFGRLPSICFPYLCTRVLNERNRTSPILLHLMHVAGAMQGCKISEFATSSAVVKADWLSDMATIYFRTLLYCRDIAFTRQGEEETDNWQCINAAGDKAKLAYDCEDGAQWIMELLWVLMHANFTNLYLVQMRDYVKSTYTIAFVFGEILVGRDDEYVPHAYTMAIDKKALQYFVTGEKQAGDEFAPAVVFEATSWIAGCCDPAQYKENKRAARVERQEYGEMLVRWKDDAEFIRTDQRTQHARRVVHMKASYGMTSGVHMHRRMFSMFAFDTKKAVQYAITTPSQRHLYAPATAIHQHRGDKVRFIPVITKSMEEGTADRRNMDMLVREFPRTRLPEAPTQEVKYDEFLLKKEEGKKVQRFLLRKEPSGDSLKNDFMRVIRQPIGTEVIHVTERELPITSHTSLYVVDVHIDVPNPGGYDLELID